MHPIEPKAMNAEDIISKYGTKLCLLGNIEMDTLIRGKTNDIKSLVLHNLKNLASNGFYACGSSNTITTPMPLENVAAMVETVKSCGKYPKSL